MIEITIIGRQMQISEEQRLLGVAGDHLGQRVAFVLSRFQEGLDLGNYSAWLSVEPAAEEREPYNQILSKTLEGDALRLKWDVNRVNTADPGRIHVCLKFSADIGEDTVVWQCLKEYFVVSPGVDAREDLSQQPPDLLQQAVTAALTGAERAEQAAVQAEQIREETELSYVIDTDRVGFRRGQEAAYTFTSPLTGPKGEPGTSFRVLGVKPGIADLLGTANPQKGDAYLVQGSVYVWSGGEWVSLGPVQGPKGDKGEPGALPLSCVSADGRIYQFSGVLPFPLPALLPVVFSVPAANQSGAALRLDGTDYPLLSRLSRPIPAGYLAAGTVAQGIVDTQTVCCWVGDISLSALTPPRGSLLLNGDFTVNQRGQSSYVNPADKTYTVDRWRASGMSACTVSILEEGGVQLVASSAGNAALEQPVEFPQRLAGKTVTFAAEMRVSAGGQAILKACRVRDGDETILAQSGFFTATGKDTAVLTLTVPSDTVSTDQILFRFGFSACAGTLDVTRAKMEEGGVFTGFAMRPFGKELSLCRRFYQKSWDYDKTLAQAERNNVTVIPSIDNNFAFAAFRAELRQAPPLDRVKIYSNVDKTPGAVDVKTLWGQAPTKKTITLYSVYSTNIGFVVNDITMVKGDAILAYWEADAEIY